LLVGAKIKGKLKQGWKEENRQTKRNVFVGRGGATGGLVDQKKETRDRSLAVFMRRKEVGVHFRVSQKGVL